MVAHDIELNPIIKSHPEWVPVTTEQLPSLCQEIGHAFFIEHESGACILSHKSMPLAVAIHPDGQTVARTTLNQLPTPEQQTLIELLLAKYQVTQKA